MLRATQILHQTTRIMPIPSSTRLLQTSAALIIGDEVLNGKISDTNSKFFARYCFALGLDLQKVEVVPDDEKDIVESIQRLAARYDFIVTSGGIGPTHDDITYEAIAKAFDMAVEQHPATVERMTRLSRRKIDFADTEARTAQLRMASFPVPRPQGATTALPDLPNTVDITYVAEDLWVPIVTVAGKVNILPGVPSLFTRLLEGIKPELEKKVDTSRQQMRFFVMTDLPESVMAPYLRRLQEKVNEKDIKIGSYPHMELKKNTVSIIGRKGDVEYLKEIVKDVEKNLKGEEISAEKEEGNSHGP
ncbi:hypothetical protein CJU90_5350 [Yarrowia sp. C11]|nr:hypothetical protein CJU90_5350 [Yarrowia sp. C11]KAG5363953.1 hypothetical protein CKK34_2729 [Yarrowia sp. E02]